MQDSLIDNKVVSNGFTQRERQRETKAPDLLQAVITYADILFMFFFTIF